MTWLKDDGFSSRLKAAGMALQGVLAEREPVTIEQGNYKPAAVLVPLWDDGGQVCMVFTMRSAALPQHAGQISFPGGGSEEGDADKVSTALRETQEEIGVDPNSVRVLSRLDQMITISDYVVTPFLGLVAGSQEFQPNPVEVERMVIVPLDKVLDLKNYRLHTVWWQGKAFNNLALEHQGDLIWGVTARMLMNLIAALGPGVSRVIKAAAC